MASTPTSTSPRPATRPPGGGARPPAPSGGMATTTVDPRKLLLTYWPWIGAAGVVGLALGVVTYVALLRVAPSYEAKVWFEFGSAITKPAEVETNIGRGGATEMERFIGTQMQVMESDEVLRRAVREPGVRDTTWIQQHVRGGGAIDDIEASLALRKIISTRTIPETNYVTLAVRAGRSDDAQRLANAMKDVYVDQRERQSNLESANTLEVLNRRLRTVQEERRVTEGRKQRMFDESGLETLNEQSTKESQQIKQLIPVLVSTQQQLSTLEDRQEQYEELRKSPGGAVYPEEIRAEVEFDPKIENLKQQITGLERAKLASLAQFGESHRQVKGIDREIAASEQQLEAERQKLIAERFAEAIELVRSRIRTLQVIQADTQEDLEEARAKLQDINRMRQEFGTLSGDANRLAEEARAVQTQIYDLRAILDRKASNRIRTVIPADKPTRPVFPNPLIIVPAITMLLVGAVTGLLFLRELFEQRVRGPADVAMIPRSRVLGVIPDRSEDPSAPESIETVMRDSPTGVIAESFRQLRTETLKRMSARDARTLLVLSGMPGSGGTSVLVNLAWSMAAAQRRVLVIDANLRRPRLHEVFEIDPGGGLAACLTGEGDVERHARQAAGASGLFVLPAGERCRDNDPRERLITKSMQRTLSEARESFDVVLVDSSPAIVSSDALQLASWCDAVALVVRAYGEKRGLIQRLGGQLHDAEAEYLGVVINGVKSSAGGYFKRNFRATHEYQHKDSGGARGDRSRRASLEPREQESPTKLNGELHEEYEEPDTDVEPSGETERGV